MVGGFHCLGEVAEHSASQLDSEPEDGSEHVDTDAMLDYIERFNELMDNKQYNMAAVHAANSPQGILRTTETLHRLAGSITSVQITESVSQSISDS